MTRRAGWGLVGVALCSALGCTREQAAGPGRPGIAVGLDEPFPMAGLQCRVRAPHETLREQPSRRADVRVLRDVRVLELGLACAREGASSVDARSLLGDGVSVTLFGPDGRTYPAALAPPVLNGEPGPSASGAAGSTSGATAASATEARLRFELPAWAPRALRRHLYRHGEGAAAPDEPVVYSVRVERGAERVAVALRHRFETPEFERWLDQLSRALDAGEGLAALGDPDHRAPLETLARAYRAVVERYRPRVLRMELTPQGDGRVALSVWPGELTRRAPPQVPLRIGLLIDPSPSAVRVVAVESTEALSRAVECERLEGELDAQLRTLDGAAETGECGAYGARLPMRCDALPARLRSAAQRFGEACGGHALPHSTPRPPPPDFQLALRRPRKKRARGGRDTLVIFGGGSVVFHRSTGGDESERHDGRTTPEAVARLWGLVETMGVLTRRGGEFDVARCSDGRDEGDVITLVAGGRERMVLDRAGCRGPFSAAELDQLEEAALAVGAIEGFTGERRRVARDPHERILTIPDEVPP